MSDPSSLRVADADREKLAGELREHLVAGRLTQEEFEERLDLAYRAATRADLDALTVDLPMTSTALQAAASDRRARLRRRTLREMEGGVTASAICVGIWAASGGGDFWPVWVMIPTLLPALIGSLRMFGGDSDLDELEARLRAKRVKRLARERRRERRYRELSQ